MSSSVCFSPVVAIAIVVVALSAGSCIGFVALVLLSHAGSQP
jgi:hypothetical protein